MNIEALALAGAHRIHVQRLSDDRGHFARLWCRGSLAAAGLSLEVVQTSASVNPRAGTLRGLHFAWPPSGEIKVVRCARGRLHDVLLDLRPHSATFGRSVTVVLDATLHDTLLVPPGVAHGFQTLVDDTEVHYMMTEAY
ncbi:MAG TPA: dTDP-4-dehydrorhamnose 3,5-epimerase family protein, partial [Rubrivivax sp.]|nr:dTDP-4-dehydrorhamnose 3,5-epimerase family protein [Rubrivivax sp.]